MTKTSTDRAGARLAWVRRASCNPAIGLASASSDASFRSYWRTVGNGRGLIVMDAPPGKEDVAAWIDIDARLACAGIHVPAIHASDLEHGFLLIEDLGEHPYLRALNACNADKLYGDAMQALLTMQSRVDTQGLPAYDAAFLRRELELLPAWCLERHLGAATSAADRDVLDAAFDVLVANAMEQPQCFVHRDFHSRNLMITDENNPGVIDFQGAVRGPITYDLASLLRDCYIVWGDAHVERWMRGYRQRLVAADLLAADVNEARFRRWFDLTALQRHLKVLGLFCRLAYRDGKPAYLQDLPRVFDYVLRVASNYAELAALAVLLRRVTGMRDLALPAPEADGAATCVH